MIVESKGRKLDTEKPLYWHKSMYGCIYCHPNWSINEAGIIFIDKEGAYIVYPEEHPTTMAGSGIECYEHSNYITDVIKGMIDNKRKSLDRLTSSITSIVNTIGELQQFLTEQTLKEVKEDNNEDSLAVSECAKCGSRNLMGVGRVIDNVQVDLSAKYGHVYCSSCKHIGLPSYSLVSSDVGEDEEEKDSDNGEDPPKCVKCGSLDLKPVGQTLNSVQCIGGGIKNTYGYAYYCNKCEHIG